MIETLILKLNREAIKIFKHSAHDKRNNARIENRLPQ